MPSGSASYERVVAGLALYAVCSCPAALSQTRDVDPRLSVRVGAATTDNLARVPGVDSKSETFATTGIDIGFLRETPRARAYVDGTIDYYAYNSDEFSNETAGAIDTGLALRVLPDVFSWEFSERIDHARLDPFTPVGPGNSERINVFSTGPRIDIPLGDSSSFTLDGQYADRHYKEREALDGPNRAVSLQLARDFRQFQRLALVVTGQDIDFDDPASSRPYEIQDTYLAYERRTAADGLFALSGGTSRLRRDGETTSEPYFQMEWTRDITPRSSLSFRGGRSFESPTDYFDSATLDGYGTGGVEDTLLTADARMTTNARLTYTLTRQRAVFRVSRERFRERYEDDAFPEREVSQFSVGMDYRFTPLLLGNVLLADSREDYDVGTSNEERARAGLQRRLGRSWEGSLSFEYNRRDYDVGGSYHERRYILSIAWSPPREAR
jgi:hypothetical protein